MIIKLIIIFILILIVGSLFSALVFMLKDKGGERTAKALTLRVAFSIGLFLLLMAGFYLGVIPRQRL